MDRNTSPIEPFGRFAPYAEPAVAAPWHRSVRARLFAVTFGLTLALGIGWTLLQPVVYRSSATVLMSAPSAVDAKVEKANIQSVAIQRRILLGGEVTQGLLSALDQQSLDAVDLQYLREVLHVKGVSDTNLVEMNAEGADAAVLPVLVNTWIDVYLDIRAKEVKQSQQQTLGVVEDQLGGLAAKLDKARDALATYRDENQISSVDRQQNEELSRLDGLNTALNLAVKLEVKTKANLDSLRQAIAAGKDVVPPSERKSVEAMENELRQLQLQLVKLNKTFTQNYVRNQPGIREIPVRIAELEASLATETAKGQALMLTNAEQEHAAALQAVGELQQRLNEQEKSAAEFTTVYTKHQALAKDLAELEALNRETQSRLTQVQVNQVEKYPQVSVIDRPGPESERVGPDYLLYLGASLAAALGAGVLSVWLYGFLGPRAAPPAYVTLSGVHMYPQDVSGHLGYSAPAEQRIGRSDPRLLTKDEGSDGPEDGAAHNENEANDGHEEENKR
jgi:succinoglycan biosynthesis transport protein ExoP